MTDTNNNPNDKMDFSHPLKNQRHEKFCQLYVTNPFNIAVIYREAGYKCSNSETDRKNAYKLLRIDAVRGRVDFLVLERNERLGLDGDEVIRGLYMMRDRCSGGEVVRDRQGKPVTEWASVDGEEKLCIVWRADVTGFLRASELLAKYHGLLTEKSEVMHKSDHDEKTEAEADDILKNLRYSKTIKPNQRKGKDGSTVDKAPIPVDTTNKVDTEEKSDYKVLNADGVVVS